EDRYKPEENKKVYQKIFFPVINYSLAPFNSDCKNLNMSQWTVWDFIIINILYCQEDSDLGGKWSDFEGLISSLIRKNSIPALSIGDGVYQEILRVLNYEYMAEIARPSDIEYDNSYSDQKYKEEMYKRIAAGVYKNYIQKPNFNVITRKIFNPLREKEYNADFKNAFDTILLKELNVLEHDFAKYIKNQVATDPDYRNNCGNLLFDLLFNDLTLNNLQEGIETHNYLLNFNYTQPQIEAVWPNLGYREYWFDYVKNVHGTAKKEDAIFGIDYEDGKDDDLVRFTKTFRSMQLEEKYSGKTFFDHLPINKIKIYGHSLNPADNSYYTSIFDAVDLYSSKTELFFYYKDREGLNLSQLDLSINNLIKEYGSTISKDHGSGLLHKLLLENRIHIRPLIEYNPMVVGEKEERQFLNLDDLDKKKRDLFTEKLESISKYNKAAADRIAEMED
ncbi:hypothetical protein ATX28_09620, partial [Oenococcus oeni]